MLSEDQFSSILQNIINHLDLRTADTNSILADILAKLSPPAVSPLLSYEAGDTNLSIGLPALSDIANLEVTLFHNEPKPGRAKWCMKFEANLGEKQFRDKRDSVVHADMFDLDDFEIKFARRKISDPYRARLKEVIEQNQAFRAETMVGMVAKRGGKAGLRWIEDQFIVIRHNGEHKPIDGTVYVGGEQIDLIFSGTHPKTKKPMAEKIRAKAIVYPALILNKTGD